MKRKIILFILYIIYSCLQNIFLYKMLHKKIYDDIILKLDPEYILWVDTKNI